MLKDLGKILFTQGRQRPFQNVHGFNPTVFPKPIISSESISDFSTAQEPKSSLIPTYEDLDIPIAIRQDYKMYNQATILFSQLSIL